MKRVQTLEGGSGNENDPLNADGTSRGDCPSFLVSESNDDQIVRFVWDGQTSIGLALVRVKTQQHTTTIHWTHASLGVTFGIEETSRRIVVTRTTRDDVRVGYVLVRAMGQEVNEANFDERIAALKRAHEISRGIPFEFVSPPPPVYVKSCGGQLKHLGIDETFELRFVGDQAIRYLSLDQLHDFIRRAKKPLALTFVQRRDSQYIALLRRNANEEAMAAAGLAAAAAVVAVSIC